MWSIRGACVVTGEDLRRLQDNFLETSKEIILEQGRMRPTGFVITLRKHAEKLFEAGWGLEFLDPKDCLGAKNDGIATLIVDLLMDWKRLYHAVLNVFPKTQDVLPKLLALGESVGVDDPYKSLMRPFLETTQMNEKDIIAATMRHICGQVDAFACIFHSEAWLRKIDRRSEDTERITKEANAKGLAQDQKSIEVIFSSMETHYFARTITMPVHRELSSDPQARDAGKILGFGEPTEAGALAGRMAGFLKPLGEAS